MSGTWGGSIKSHPPVTDFFLFLWGKELISETIHSDHLTSTSVFNYSCCCLSQSWGCYHAQELCPHAAIAVNGVSAVKPCLNHGFSKGALFEVLEAAFLEGLICKTVFLLILAFVPMYPCTHAHPFQQMIKMFQNIFCFPGAVFRYYVIMWIDANLKTYSWELNSWICEMFPNISQHYFTSRFAFVDPFGLLVILD